MTVERDKTLLLSDDDLFRECRFDRMRGTGPGGQKRNKTESCVRLTHLPTGIVATDDVSRSQHTNRENALRKLRFSLALSLREPFALPPIQGDPTNQQLPLWLAHAFDALAEAEWQVVPAAKQMQCSTSHFLKFIAKSPVAWQRLISERQARNLPPLSQR